MEIEADVDFNAESEVRSSIEYTSVTDPQFVDVQKELISCMITFPHIQDAPMPFIAGKVDSTDYGPKIYQEIMDGKYGPIKPMDQEVELERVTTGAKMNRSANMTSTDWLVNRHRDEKEMGDSTSLSEDQFKEVLEYRRDLRDWPTKAEFPNGMPTAPAWMTKGSEQ